MTPQLDTAAPANPFSDPPGGFRVARVRCDDSGRGVRRLVVTGVTRAATAAPYDAGRLGLGDPVLIAVGGEQPLDRLLSGVTARPGDPAAALVLDKRPSGGWSWRAAVRSHAGPVPVETVRVVGANPLLLVRRGAESRTAVDDAARYSRLAGAVSPAVTRRLRRAEVTVVGCGRTGSAVAQQLACLGVARLRLIDPDVLEPHNLDAAPGLRAKDVGTPKAVALARALRRSRPDLVAQASVSLGHSGPGADLLAAPADLLVSAVDRDEARLAVSLAARRAGVPHLDLASEVQAGEPPRGDARLLLPGDRGGCVACIGGLGDLNAALDALAAPPDCLRRGQPIRWNDQRAGSLVTLNHLTVSAGVQLWLDALRGAARGSRWQRLRWELGSGLRADGGPVEGDTACPFCGDAFEDDKDLRPRIDEPAAAQFYGPGTRVLISGDPPVAFVSIDPSILPEATRVRLELFLQPRRPNGLPIGGPTALDAATLPLSAIDPGGLRRACRRLPAGVRPMVAAACHVRLTPVS